MSLGDGQPWERLRSAIADEDADKFEESLPAALADVDNPLAEPSSPVP